MKIAVVWSDVSSPPQEGLHQQSLLLARSLVDRGHDVWCLGFVRQSTGRAERASLIRSTGAQLPLALVEYSGSSIIYAQFGARRSATQIIELLHTENFDSILLEGVVAASLGPLIEHPSVVYNLVDPGSRRHWRKAKAARSPTDYLFNRLAAFLYHRMERKLCDIARPWVFVSNDDSSYVRVRYPAQWVATIPVMLSAETSPSPLVPGMDGVYVQNNYQRPVVLYVDGRAADGRRALKCALAELSRHEATERLKVVVLARTDEDDELLRAASGLDVRFVAWARDPIEIVRSASLVILPDLVGTGIKNRAVQSLSVGVRTLGTDVAMEGIPLLDAAREKFVYVPGELGARVDQILADQDMRQLIGAQAAATQSWFAADRVVDAWERLISSTARH